MISLSQEPVVYMNGQSFTPRLRERMNENMEFPGVSGDYIEWLQDNFVQVIQSQIAESRENRFIKKEERGKVSWHDMKNENHVFVKDMYIHTVGWNPKIDNIFVTSLEVH